MNSLPRKVFIHGDLVARECFPHSRATQTDLHTQQQSPRHRSRRTPGSVSIGRRKLMRTMEMERARAIVSLRYHPTCYPLQGASGLISAPPSRRVDLRILAGAEGVAIGARPGAPQIAPQDAPTS